MNKWIWIIVALVVLGGGWYWWSTQNGASSAQPATTAGTNGSPYQGNTGAAPDQSTGAQATNATATGGATLNITTDAKLGQILTASNGMTVYTKSTDTAGKSTCTGTCAQAWPPYTVASLVGITIPTGLNGNDVTGLTRADGSVQLMYKGMPLYFYAKDTKAGDTMGQGVGSTWYVVTVQ